MKAYQRSYGPFLVIVGFELGTRFRLTKKKSVRASEVIVIDVPPEKDHGSYAVARTGSFCVPIDIYLDMADLVPS